MNGVARPREVRRATGTKKKDKTSKGAIARTTASHNTRAGSPKYSMFDPEMLVVMSGSRTVCMDTLFASSDCTMLVTNSRMGARAMLNPSVLDHSVGRAAMMVGVIVGNVAPA